MTPAPLRVRSFAKLNLGLAVGPKRPDGYHSLATLYQTIDLSDTLEFRFGGKPVWRVETDSPSSVPSGERNIVWRAIELLRPFMRRPVGVEVFIRKKIPDGAGLGGGSGDAAAALLTLNRTLRLNVPCARLHAIAATLGSDVPFFLMGGTALGIGRGEILCSLGDIFGKEIYYALAVPEARLSTASVYRAADAMKSVREGNLIEYYADVLRAVERKSWRTLSLRNDLEAAAMRLAPEIGALKRALGTGAAMTGSGSGVFALFDTKREAERAVKRAAKAVPRLRLAHAGRLLGKSRASVLP